MTNNDLKELFKTSFDAMVSSTITDAFGQPANRVYFQHKEKYHNPEVLREAMKELVIEYLNAGQYFPAIAALNQAPDLKHAQEIKTSAQKACKTAEDSQLEVAENIKQAFNL